MYEATMRTGVLAAISVAIPVVVAAAAGFIHRSLFWALLPAAAFLIGAGISITGRLGT